MFLAGEFSKVERQRLGKVQPETMIPLVQKRIYFCILPFAIGLGCRLQLEITDEPTYGGQCRQNVSVKEDSPLLTSPNPKSILTHQELDSTHDGELERLVTKLIEVGLREVSVAIVDCLAVNAETPPSEQT